VKLHFDLPATQQSGAVPTEYRREILLIYKELLHNAHRHARATNLWISLTNDDSENTLCLTVRDDGRGFDPAAGHLNGNGIGFLHKRAEALGGKFEFQSMAGQGTTARLEVAYERLPIPILTDS
jgi:signal transduction histidine kinase